MAIPRKLSRFIKWLLIVLVILLITVLILFSWKTEVTKNIDTYIYELPFQKGTRHKVVQGYGRLFSHKNIAALDFEMPVGTPVCAAREGIVYNYRDNSDEGGMFSGYKDKANYIMIKHDDGSIGCYWHLKKDGVLVKTGRVAKGQPIGLSGATGQVIKPHLHFSVKRKLSYEMNSFVQTKFRTMDGILIPRNWKTYERP